MDSASRPRPDCIRLAEHGHLRRPLAALASRWRAMPRGQVVTLAPLWGPYALLPSAGSTVWTWATDTNRFAVCWENLLLEGDPARPATVQCDLAADGTVRFRYGALADSDGDGPSDSWELANAFDPLAPQLAPPDPDTDRDGVPDRWEDWLHTVHLWGASSRGCMVVG